MIDLKDLEKLEYTVAYRNLPNFVDAIVYYFDTKRCVQKKFQSSYSDIEIGNIVILEVAKRWRAIILFDEYPLIKVKRYRYD